MSKFEADRKVFKAHTTFLQIKVSKTYPQRLDKSLLRQTN